MTTTQDTQNAQATQDFAAYVASSPCPRRGRRPLPGHGGAGAARRAELPGGWALPGGTIESDDGESPREGARRETAEEIGLDRPLGRLLAVDWVRTEGVPPLVAYLYDGGVLGEDELRAIRLQEEELLSWRLVEREEIPAHLPGSLGRRVLAALDVLADGSGTAELEDGRRVH